MKTTQYVWVWVGVWVVMMLFLAMGWKTGARIWEVQLEEALVNQCKQTAKLSCKDAWVGIVDTNDWCYFICNNYDNILEANGCNEVAKNSYAEIMQIEDTGEYDYRPQSKQFQEEMKFAWVTPKKFYRCFEHFEDETGYKYLGNITYEYSPVLKFIEGDKPRVRAWLNEEALHEAYAMTIDGYTKPLRCDKEALLKY